MPPLQLVISGNALIISRLAISALRLSMASALLNYVALIDGLGVITL